MDEPEKPTFEKELESLLNKYSKDYSSATPDFILADYLVVVWSKCMRDLTIKFETDEARDLFKKWFLGFGASRFAYEVRAKSEAPNNLDFEGFTVMLTKQEGGNLAEPKYVFDEVAKYFGSNSDGLPNPSVGYWETGNSEGNVTSVNTELSPDLEEIVSLVGTEEQNPVTDLTDSVVENNSQTLDNQEMTTGYFGVVNQPEPEEVHGRDDSKEFNTFGGVQ